MALAALLLVPVPVAAAPFLAGWGDTPSALPSAVADQMFTRPALGYVPPESAAQAAAAGDDEATQPQATRRKTVIRATRHERVVSISADTSYDVPRAALRAYRAAAASLAVTDPACHLSWGVVAAIGRVESNHGRFAGAAVLASGRTVPSIVGLPLNGVGRVAQIHDTDGGRLDGDRVWDRAVGPMQFIPSTWAFAGVDGDGDGARDPNDFDDAALAAALYLCGGTSDMRNLGEARAAVLRYNHSREYVDLVLRLANAYDSGVVDVVPNDKAPRWLREGGRELAGGPRDKARQHGHQPGRKHDRDHPNTPPVHQPHHPKPPSPPGEPGPPGPSPTPPTPPSSTPPPPTPTPPPPTPPGTEVTGTLTTCGDAWCVDDAVLDFGADADLLSVQEDYDADGTTEPVATELEGLVDVEVTVTLDPDGLVTAINDLPFSAEATAPTAPTPSPTEPTPSPTTEPTPGTPTEPTPSTPTSTA